MSDIYKSKREKAIFKKVLEYPYDIFVKNSNFKDVDGNKISYKVDEIFDCEKTRKDYLRQIDILIEKGKIK